MQGQNNWHAQTAQDVISAWKTSQDSGLTDQQIASLHAQYGDNELTQHEHDGPIKRFLLQFHQPLVYILLSATLVTLLLQEWVDSAVIFAVVLVNAIIGFVQESKALTAINALSSAIQSTANVIRNGNKLIVDARELVPGDIVLLQAGDKVAADMRLIKVKDLQVDESALTGESLPVEKRTEPMPQQALLGDRQNMAFSSTLVVYGTGIGVVTHTGDHTEIGKISHLIATTQTLDTPLTKKIKQFSHVLLYAIVALAAITVLVGYLHGQPLLSSFMAAVALAVGAIPEGLPAAVTIMLAIGVSRMARRKAVIRNLPAVETLGSTTVICSDKTGTLTKNEMTVEYVYADGKVHRLTGHGYDPEGQILSAANVDSPAADITSSDALSATLRAGVLCNDATLLAPDNTSSQWRITGDPTEAALLVAAQKASSSASQACERIDTIPFQSEYQYMATLNPVGLNLSQDDSLPGIYLKGSVESVLARCALQLTQEGETTALNTSEIMDQVTSFASQGLRVLAFAYKSSPAQQRELTHLDVASDMIFLGLQAMIDPPRPEAIEAVSACHQAGIDVKMITGDHALTATSIARQLGIIGQDERDPTITGAELLQQNEAAFSQSASQYHVFARVTPENKLELVKALQEKQQVVAMTGDGVNDAPALRRADIGVAMALNGTEVAREAADMMLTDDNFATVQAAVEEGRSVFDNLKKFIVWTLPTNGGEGLVILLAVILGLALPLLPVHILWVNMTTAVLLGLMLAFEPKEKGLMHRPPHSPNAPILDSVLIWRIVLVSSLLCLTAFGLYELELMWGATEDQARTVAVAMFVVGEAFYLFNCRSLEKSVLDVGLFSNLWLWWGVAFMMLLQLGFTYLPFMNAWFQSAPISLQSWLRVFACSLAISAIVGAEKSIRAKRKAKT